MKHSYLFRTGTVLLFTAFFSENSTAQCPISVEAGPDVHICAPLTPYTMDAEITGEFLDSKWTPSAPVEYPNYAKSPVRATQTTTFAFSARSVDPGENLIQNPDFEQGNTAFTSSLTYSPGNIVPLNTYDILANPQTANDTLLPCGDHTTGSGLFLAANTGHSSITMWCQTVQVTPSTDYFWSYWVSRINQATNGGHVAIVINGFPQSHQSQGLFGAQPCEWRQIKGIWNSGSNTTAQICFLKTKLNAAVGLDDIFFAPVCTVKDSMTIFVTDLKAVAVPNKYVIPCTGYQQVISAAGSSDGPDIVQQWTATKGNIVSGENTLFPVVDAAGVYNLSVSLPGGIGECEKKASVEVTVSDELKTWINAPPRLNCNGPTPLIGNSSITINVHYEWTESATGNIVSGHNSATALVDAPGLYTLVTTNLTTGCTSEATVFMNAPLFPTASIAPPDTLQTLPDTVQLSATVLPVNAGISWYTLNGHIVSGANTLSPSVSAPGTYLLVVTHPISLCKDTVSVVVHARSECPSGVHAGPDRFLCQPGLTTQLSASITDAYHDLSWSPSAGLSDPTVPDPMATVAQTADFVLSARLFFLNQNLLANGGFEAGDTGFSTDLTANHTDLTQPGRYAVLPIPAAADPALPACGHHGSGTGNLLAARLSASAGKPNIWCQTVPVKPGTDYRFSAWALQLSGDPSLRFFANGDSLGALALLSGDSCSWHQFAAAWHSGTNSSVTLCLSSTDTNGALALDDLFFTPLCVVRDTVRVHVAETPLVAVIAPPNILSCTAPTLSLDASASGTGPGLGFSWSTANGAITAGANGPNPTVNTPGTYELLLTDTGNGCTATASVTVTADVAAPPVSAAPPAVLTCSRTEQILLAQNAAPTGSFSYQWTASSGGQIASDANGLQPLVHAPGTYTLVATNTDNGCTATLELAVAQDVAAPPISAAAPAVLTCSRTEQILLAQNAAPTGTFSYQWTASGGGQIASGANDLQPLVHAPGTYTLLATNADNGCTASLEVAVSQDVTAPLISAAPPAVLTCSRTEQILLAQNIAPTGSFSYQWTASGGGQIASGANDLQPLVNAPGTYTLLATNADNGCTASLEVAVAQDVAAPPISAVAPAVLTCSLTEQILLAQNAAPTGSFSYQWTASGGGQIASGANDLQPLVNAPGTYTLVATNADNGCTASLEVIVTQNAPVQAMLLGQSDATCFGASDGSLNAAALGGDGVFVYQWSSGDNGPMAANLLAGTYTLLVTDGSGCTATASGAVGQPDPVVPNAVSTAPTTFGGSDGTASATPTGGTPPYVFLWNTNASEPKLTGLPAGQYTVTVTDANGCTAVQTVEVFGGACDLLASADAKDPACHGAPTGNATALAQGGSAPITYLWSNGQSNQTANGLTAGTYSVTLTDANGCTDEAAVSLSDPPLLSLALVATTDASCPDAPDGSATVLPDGGTGLITINWSNGEQGPVASALSAGENSAAATDENGCTATLTLNIQANDTEPPVVFGGTNSLALGPAGVISLSLQNLGIGATDNCALDVELIEPGSFDCLQLGLQTVTVTVWDAAGNSASHSITLMVQDDLPPQVECPSASTHCATDATVEYLAPVATDNCLQLGGQFDLIEGLPSGSAFPVGTTTNRYTFTDASGNVGSCSFVVTVLAPLVIALDELSHDVGSQGIGKILVITSGSQPGYTYEWQRDGQTVATTEDLLAVGAGAYLLVVTDAAGCSAEAGPFVVDDLVGTDAPDWASRAALYPNPTTGLLHVWLPADTLGTELRFVLYDARGRLALEQRAVAQNRTTLDCSPLAGGLYTLLIGTERGQAAYRVVVAR